MGARYTVCARYTGSAERGLVQLTVTVDAPGTQVDRQFTEVADLGAYSCVDNFVFDKVKTSG